MEKSPHSKLCVLCQPLKGQTFLPERGTQRSYAYCTSMSELRLQISPSSWAGFGTEWKEGKVWVSPGKPWLRGMVCFGCSTYYLVIMSPSISWSWHRQWVRCMMCESPLQLCHLSPVTSKFATWTLYKHDVCIFHTSSFSFWRLDKTYCASYIHLATIIRPHAWQGYDCVIKYRKLYAHPFAAQCPKTKVQS